LQEADGLQAEVRIAPVQQQTPRHFNSLAESDIVRLDADELASLLFTLNKTKTQEHWIHAACKDSLVPDGLRLGNRTTDNFAWGVITSRHISISAVLVPKVSSIFLFKPISSGDSISWSF
jgi:hypothetical protein